MTDEKYKNLKMMRKYPTPSKKIKDKRKMKRVSQHKIMTR